MAKDAEDTEGDVAQESGFTELSKAEERVLRRLTRARVIARLVAPDDDPDLEDLIELAEMIGEEGG